MGGDTVKYTFGTIKEGRKDLGGGDGGGGALNPLQQGEGNQIRKKERIGGKFEGRVYASCQEFHEMEGDLEKRVPGGTGVFPAKRLKRSSRPTQGEGGGQSEERIGLSLTGTKGVRDIVEKRKRVSGKTRKRRIKARKTGGDMTQRR